MSYYGFRPYVPIAQRRLQALREMEKLKKKGQTISPVAINGRKIAESFWGKAWCDNLERYSDFANRLPRGRTYVRNGSVVDLQIERGVVRAMVSGSSIYKVKIDIGAISQQRWRAIVKDCAGSIGSLVELLSGKLSKNVMERVCREGDGLFPAPTEIKMSCSCPDWAGMCKHVAATLYGAGARLDAAPDLLFTLRGVDRTDLIAAAGADLPMTRTGGARERILADDDVAALFGVVMAPTPMAAKAKPKDVKSQAKSAKTARAGAKDAKAIRGQARFERCSDRGAQTAPKERRRKSLWRSNGCGKAETAEGRHREGAPDAGEGGRSSGNAAAPQRRENPRPRPHEGGKMDQVSPRKKPPRSGLVTPRSAGSRSMDSFEISLHACLMKSESPTRPLLLETRLGRAPGRPAMPRQIAS
ncbi:MAG: hypothetical protein ABSD90_16450 [Methylocystis sp.]